MISDSCRYSSRSSVSLGDSLSSYFLLGDTPQTSAEPLLLQLRDGLDDLPRRGLDELRQADVTELGLRVHHEVPAVVGLAPKAHDRLDLDLLANHLDVARFFLAGTLHRDRDLGAR